jgi:hypothetical protein
VLPESADESAEDSAAADTIEEIVTKDALTYVTEQFIAATGERPGQLDWDLAESIVEKSDGVPITVGWSIKNAATSAAFQ